MPQLTNRLAHAWNAFMGRDPTEKYYYDIGPGDSFISGKTRPRFTSERTIVNSIYTRISIDAAACQIRHVRVNEDGQYISTIKGKLNDRFVLNANKDQTGRQFIQSAIQSMFDEGVIAIVPVDTSEDPILSDSYKINSLRVGKILEWYPDNIKVEIYNDKTGIREQLILPKRIVAICENPFYSVMNEPNSTAKRLMRKINLLDQSDDKIGSSKLDLIIQVPYSIKSPAQREYAKNRKKDIEFQLAGSKYGIAYIDGTEKVTQLNRSLENNLQNTVKDLQKDLYSQLGMTEEVMLGTADEQTMLNYYNRTIEPVLATLTEAMQWKFLTQTAITQGQAIKFFREPFKLVPVNQIAEIADKFTRNEVLSPNEIRSIVGFKPVADQGADELRNRNLNQSTENSEPYPDLEDYSESE